ncbi:MAG TPA: NAD(P)/FAD-dependent oxidoreductase [Flavisolibacter sp.]|nr:NAD(P)/FAD-dependent oxidoreductase [Flavisolibacter sp.]
MKKEVVIIGAGLVGSLLSIYMAKKGYVVTIYERRSDMRRETVEAGRSINLALSDRGIKALNEVGIINDILGIAIPMHGRYIHKPEGGHAFQPYGKTGEFINSVSRYELNCRLMDLAEQHGVSICFRHKCEDIDWQKNEITFRAGEDELSVIPFSICFAADGAFSAARLAHMLHHNKFDYHQYYIDCGYKELSIPAGENKSYLLEKNALHIWPRKDYMLIALPNPDGSFTGTLFFPFEGPLSFEKLTTKEAVTSFFTNTFPDVVDIIPDLTEQFFNNPTSSLVTVKCSPWIRDGKFCLIGDAAHAIVPFFGQGMNAGFEDCSILNELMELHGDDWETILSTFQSLRKPDGDAIADLAVNNFVEMRAKTADPRFLLQKKIEARLHERHPDIWIPAYSQVTFHPEIRYSNALANSQKQDTIMQGIMSLPDIKDKWDSKEVEDMILEQFKSEINNDTQHVKV